MVFNSDGVYEPAAEYRMRQYLGSLPLQRQSQKQVVQLLVGIALQLLLSHEERLTSFALSRPLKPSTLEIL